MLSLEEHPLKPFIPENARLLMLGSFPPPRSKWSMEFFYPNFINDMWRIFGIVFFKDKEHFIIKGEKKFDKAKLAEFLGEKGIAVYDSVKSARRLKGNASDKFLEVAEPVNLKSLLRKMPECGSLCVTGGKALEIVGETFGVSEPKVGTFADFCFEGRRMKLWRMPSSSRAYPMAVEKKAAFYAEMFEDSGML